MHQTHVGMSALAAAIFIGAIGAASAAPIATTNPPPAAGTDRTYGSGDATRRGEGRGRLEENDNGVLQQKTRIMRMMGRPEVVKDLNLSSDQMSVLKAAREDLTRRSDATIRKLEISLVSQVELLKQDNPDTGALDEAVEASGRLRTELAKLRMQHLVLVLKTINPDQRRKLNVLLREAGDMDKKKGDDNGRRERVKQMLSDRKDMPDANTNAPAAKP